MLSQSQRGGIVPKPRFCEIVCAADACGGCSSVESYVCPLHAWEASDHLGLSPLAVWLQVYQVENKHDGKQGGLAPQRIMMAGFGILTLLSSKVKSGRCKCRVSLRTALPAGANPRECSECENVLSTACLLLNEKPWCLDANRANGFVIARRSTSLASGYPPLFRSRRGSLKYHAAIKHALALLTEGSAARREPRCKC